MEDRSSVLQIVMVQPSLWLWLQMGQAGLTLGQGQSIGHQSDI